jgi:hypothetical protein
MARAAMRVTGTGRIGDAPMPDPSAPGATKPRSHLTWLLAGGACFLLLAIVALIVLHRTPDAAATSAGVSGASIELAGETAVLEAPQDHLRIFRLAQAPAILVLAFPSLHEQALALDRIGAFVEKAGMPHDRVMSDQELLSRIKQAGESFDSFYYGHDYRAADLARFFAAASEEGVTLDQDERALRALLREQGLLRPGAVGAVISLPPLSTDPPVDAAERATILRHEVSHGVYFTDAAYAAYTQHVWADVMTERERAAFRRMLGGEGYDTSNDDLMRNEMQAYLVHTPDRRFFNPSGLGIDAESLRRRFVSDMPPGWLRDETEHETAAQ